MCNVINLGLEQVELAAQAELIGLVDIAELADLCEEKWLQYG